MDTVLIQEVLRYNSLLQKIKTTLITALKVLKGKVSITAEAEEVIASVRINKIPGTWAKTSYPSLKTLINYLKDL